MIGVHLTLNEMIATTMAWNIILLSHEVHYLVFGPSWKKISLLIYTKETKQINERLSKTITDGDPFQHCIDDSN